MNSAQVIAFQPGICVQNYQSHVLPKGIINFLPQIQCIGKRDKQHIRFKSLKPICAGGKGNDDEVLFCYLFSVIILVCYCCCDRK
jgi:hypothetical protein